MPLVSVAALAMGVQSAITRRLGVEGLSTTYVTGALTGMAGRIVEPRGRRAATGPRVRHRGHDLLPVRRATNPRMTLPQIPRNFAIKQD